MAYPRVIRSSRRCADTFRSPRHRASGAAASRAFGVVDVAGLRRLSHLPHWLSAVAVALMAVGSAAQAATAPDEKDTFMAGGQISTSSFGELPDGREVTLYHLDNANGMQMSVIPYGGIIVSLKVLDADGQIDDVVLGFPSLQGYLSDAYREANPYFGALIGRYGNRIAGGSFRIDGERFELPTNDGDNTLHGGNEGFDRRLWQVAPFVDESGVGLVLTLQSPDADQGFPGTLSTEVRYTLTADNALDIRYRATTSATTPVNLTQHSYFNLEGEGQGDILDHRLMLNADAFTPVDQGLIPTGDVRKLAQTPFDFRTATAIGERIEADHPQLERGRGYDHNFVIDRGGSSDDELVLAARVEAPKSGRVLEVFTTEPGIQFYSGNFLDGSLIGKSGQAYEQRGGLALETQHFPDSPNQANFPSTLLEPGDTYASHTRYRFTTRDR
ncbi:aldose epimerase family protein [Halomonas sp. V046]|uniref:aldose epimerase family protein n=1 Tax=Halomonas sp. V046 TaxID=3459611 RepID=UPI0040445358